MLDLQWNWTGITTAVVALAASYLMYQTWIITKLKRYGFKGPPAFPVVGTLYQDIRMGFRKTIAANIKKYGKVYCSAMGSRSLLYVGDPDIVKQIVVKDFQSFQNHQPTGTNEEPLNKTLTELKDDHWKHVRSLLTPTFSTGKLKRMKSHMAECCKTLVVNLTKTCEKGESFEAKEIFGYYTMDVIARTAFGIDVDSQNNPDSPFVVNANRLVNFDFTNPGIIVFLFAPFLAPVAKKLGLRFIQKDVSDFFSSVVKETMDTRKDSGKGAVDFMQLMINAHNEKPEGEESSANVTNTPDAGNKKSLTMDEILGSSLFFFIAGYDTTANALAFTLFELARNPDVQGKICEEIQEELAEGEELTYEIVHKLEYLDMVINESLRMHPPAPITDRVCGRDTTINGTVIPKGTVINIPIVHLQNDPDVWPEPEKFKPERFTAEAKAARHPYQYMPFGLGPRMCIGNRLALYEVKMAIINIVQKFELAVNEKTKVPLEVNLFTNTVKTGIHIDIQKRK